MESADQGFGRFNAEVVRLAKRDVTTHAERVGYLIHRFLHDARPGYGQKVHVFGIWFQFARHVVWQIDDVVLIVAAAAEKKLLALLQHPDDAKFFGANLNRLTYRRAKLKEIVGDF